VIRDLISMNKTRISELGEERLIDIILDKRDARLEEVDDLLRRSYSDDSALILNELKYGVVTSDMLIEHSHFPRPMSPYQMGLKCVCVNVCDVIAMNAMPVALIVSMALPSSMLLDDFCLLVDGVLDGCDRYGVRLIGGDINEGSEIILSATAIGEAGDDVKFQDSVVEGNLVAVSGMLGSPAAALDILDEGGLVEEYADIVDTLLEPENAFECYKSLRNYSSMITSMTDITDGLAKELATLMKKNSGIGFEVYGDRIPYDKRLDELSCRYDRSLDYYLYHFGEEFELLMTLDERLYDSYEDELDLHVIGRVNDSGRMELVDGERRRSLSSMGYEHLKE